MGGNKARLKHDVFRRLPLSRTALHLVPLGRGTDAHPPGAAVRWVFEDASVRMAAPGARCHTGSDLAAAFIEPVLRTFALHANVHTYVMCFDKPTLVTAHKDAVHVQRNAAMQRRLMAQAPSTTTTTTTVCLVGRDVPLPVWTDLRQRRADYQRAIDELVRLVARTVCLRGEQRLILDWQGSRLDEHAGGHVPWCVTANNVVREAHEFANWYGEADLCSQFYAMHALGHVATAAALPPGDIVLRTVDTDYFALSVLTYAHARDARHGAVTAAPPREPTYNVWLALGVAHVTPDGSYCERARHDAVPHYELYSVRDVCATIEHEVQVSCLSFAAFCVACGNDYVHKPHGLSHLALWHAFCHEFGRGRGHLAVRVPPATAAPHTLYAVVLPGALCAWLAKARRRRASGGNGENKVDDTLRHWSEVMWALEYIRPDGARAHGSWLDASLAAAAP